MMISYPVALEKKIKKFLAEKNTYVVSDFDGTLTDPNELNSWSIFEKILGDEHNAEAEALRYKYFRIENDTSISRKYKEKQMQQWWSESLAALRRYAPKDILDKIKENKLKLRDGATELMSLLVGHNTPFVVISGGIGEVIEANTSGAYIIANYFSRNEPIIHSLNKSEFIPPMYHEKNIILLGDREYDALPFRNSIKIGYLEDNSKIETYCNHYDIVLIAKEPDFCEVKYAKQGKLVLKDRSMNFVNNILNMVLQ